MNPITPLGSYVLTRLHTLEEALAAEPTPELQARHQEMEWMLSFLFISDESRFKVSAAMRAGRTLPDMWDTETTRQVMAQVRARYGDYYIPWSWFIADVQQALDAIPPIFPAVEDIDGTS